MTAAQKVFQFLKEKGFSITAPRNGAKASYEGPLPFFGKKIPIRLDILDWNFKKRPDIRLLSRPPELSGYRAHLGLSSSVCYLDRESVHMDRYDPVRVVGRCLIEAQQTLEDVAGNKGRHHLHGEFLANWLANSTFPLVLWEPATDVPRLLSVINVDFPYDKGTCAITDDLSRTTDMLTSMNATCGTRFEKCVCEFATDVPPAFDPDHWPPARLRDALNWLKGWDPALHHEFRSKMEGEWTQNKEFIVALFSTPGGRFGFSFNVPYENPSERKRLATRGGDRRQRIQIYSPEISRFTMSDLSPSFVHGRNQPDRETLSGKHIALIGCGTVGGYLASFLARLGAGFGGGSLRLYDEQKLQPENLGRHLLGAKELYRRKAEGLRDHIRAEFSYLKVESRVVDATEAKDVFDADLVIDATGSSFVSSILNEQHLARLKTGTAAPAVIYTWVEGPGDAARCLLVDSLKHMCQECQFVRGPDLPLSDRLPITNRPPESARVYPGDCSSYVPFAVSAATTAAGLALDMARDWARGNPHPRLRARRLNMEATQARADSSPPPLKSCPACQA